MSLISSLKQLCYRAGKIGYGCMSSLTADGDLRQGQPVIVVDSLASPGHAKEIKAIKGLSERRKLHLSSIIAEQFTPLQRVIVWCFRIDGK